jgi:hypothetical protein
MVAACQKTPPPVFPAFPHDENRELHRPYFGPFSENPAKNCPALLNFLAN